MTSHEVIERRRRERADLIGRAAGYADDIGARMPVRAVVVFGSVARGDFNAWSDIDVLVVCDRLPAGGRPRLAVLHQDGHIGIQPVGWTQAEFLDRLRRGDPIATEAVGRGVVVRGALPVGTV